MSKSTEKKAIQILTKKYPTCLIACLDDMGALHFDFATKKEWSAENEIADTIALLLSMIKQSFMEEGHTEEEFWGAVINSVNDLQDGRFIG